MINLVSIIKNDKTTLKLTMTSIDICLKSKGVKNESNNRKITKRAGCIVGQCGGRVAPYAPEVVRQAIEYYLEDFEDLNLALQALRDPADVVLDWETVKNELLNQH